MSLPASSRKGMLPGHQPMRRQWAALALSASALLALAGCGTPGTPLPPSLKLPDPVTDLSAVRTGNTVALAWTMPRKNTDKLLIKGSIPVRVCHTSASGGCDPVDAAVAFEPNAKATFTETLPPSLASGASRPLTYFVELRSPRGRAAGPSNVAHVLAGQAPGPVEGLSARLQKGGVVLRWTSGDIAGSTDKIRLHRTLLTPHENRGESAANPGSKKGFMAPEKEPVEQTLLVDAATSGSHAIDTSIHFGETYEYRAQRVARGVIDGQTVELAGPLSEPIRVDAVDTFPPAVPTGLAAVATAADSAAGPSIDLSWLPVTEADLAGYAVYRREGEGVWQRISAKEPIVGPAFHDPDVAPGHSYRYAVTAIDKLGHESAHSEEAGETVPNP